MRRGTFLIAICLAWLTALHRPAIARECSAAAFHKDHSATLDACSAILSQKNLPDDVRAEALKIRGRSYHRLERVELAVADYEHAIFLNPNDPELHLWRGWAAIGLERAMTSAMRALELNKDYAAAIDLVGMILWHSGNLVRAMETFDQAIAMDPNAMRFRFHRFQLLEYRARQREALVEAEAILALQTPDLDRPNEIMILGKRTSMRTAIRLHRALLFSKMGRFEEADKAFDDIIAEAPSALTLAQRASYRLLRRAPLDAVQSDIDRAMLQEPDYWAVHEIQARVHRHAKRPHAALDSFTKAVKLNPTHSRLRWARALALRALGQIDEATAEGVHAAEADGHFLMTVVKILDARGYLPEQLQATTEQSLIRDAIRACMLDERCG
jgi:tetratricopeptide (TPR) repeat protein